MIITIGESEYTVKILPQFSPLADYAIKWSRATNGALLKCDRGLNSDVHTCGISLAGAKADIIAVYGALTSAECDGITDVVLSAGEYLFGPATYLAAVTSLAWVEIGELNQRTLTTWGFSATVAMNGAVPYAGSPALPMIFYPDSSASIVATNGNAPRPFYEVFLSGFDPVSHTTDSAEYQFTCVMDQAEAANFQAFYDVTNRGATIANVGPDFTLSGVADPFGPTYEYPCAVIFRDVSFSPMGPQYWRVSITLVRAK